MNYREIAEGIFEAYNNRLHFEKAMELYPKEVDIIEKWRELPAENTDEKEITLLTKLLAIKYSKLGRVLE